MIFFGYNFARVGQSRTNCQFVPPGKVPEWLNGTVSKTVVGLVSTEGSNPSLPADRPSRKWLGFLLPPRAPLRGWYSNPYFAASGNAPAQAHFDSTATAMPMIATKRMSGFFSSKVLQ